MGRNDGIKEKRGDVMNSNAGQGYLALWGAVNASREMSGTFSNPKKGDLKRGGIETSDVIERRAKRGGKRTRRKPRPSKAVIKVDGGSTPLKSRTKLVGFAGGIAKKSPREEAMTP